jgi:hypothetical protein
MTHRYGILYYLYKRSLTWICATPPSTNSSIPVTGAKGDKGDPGPPRTLSVNQRVGNFVHIPPNGGMGSSTTKCNPGEMITGGGFNTDADQLRLSAQFSGGGLLRQETLVASQTNSYNHL